MVVDLGTSRTPAQATPTWAGTAPQYRILTSTDGLNWSAFTAGGAARYVAVEVQTWAAGVALAELDVR